ncbi:MAG: molybdopterin-binding protein, partial [Clostridiales Family XIII bacterium]|nr:molybdopterin-binding protein [Clostridiales Family XIII bacterium]
LKMKAAGADVIFVTGGMSVDPDDRTPLAIRDSGARVATYGAPVLPGAMFLVAYFDDGTAVLGLPGCVMHSKVTIFDLLLPRVMAGIEITKDDVNALAVGGLCLDCETCIWPACGFGAV